MVKYSDEELLQALRDCMDEHGTINNQLLNKGDGYPSGPTYGYRFDSLADAVEQAGMEKEARKIRGRKVGRGSSYTTEEIIEYLENLSDDDGKLTKKEIRTANGPRIITILRYLDIDKIDDLGDVCDVEIIRQIDRELSSREDVVSGLKLADSENEYITYDLLNSDDSYPSKKEVQYYFGGLTNAASDIGITTIKNVQRPKHPFNGEYVYVLKLSDGGLYVGETSNLLQRLSSHEKNKDVETIERVVLVKDNENPAEVERLTAIEVSREYDTTEVYGGK